MEPGESHEESLAREIQEEFGIAISVGAHIMTVEHRSPDVPIRLIAYFATAHEDLGDSTDHDQTLWVTPEGLLDHDLAEADIPIARELQNRLG